MQYIASISYGKDSLAMLEAIKILGLPLDRIVTAEVWATDTIPADLPPMMEFKGKADRIIKERYGIDVEHFFATKSAERERETVSGLTNICSTESICTHQKRLDTQAHRTQSLVSQAERNCGVNLISKSQQSTSPIKLTYQDQFYTKRRKRNVIYGFPIVKGAWCNSRLKMEAIKSFKKARHMSAKRRCSTSA